KKKLIERFHQELEDLKALLDKLKRRESALKPTAATGLENKRIQEEAKELSKDALKQTQGSKRPISVSIEKPEVSPQSEDGKATKIESHGNEGPRAKKPKIQTVERDDSKMKSNNEALGLASGETGWSDTKKNLLKDSKILEEELKKDKEKSVDGDELLRDVGALVTALEADERDSITMNPTSESQSNVGASSESDPVLNSPEHNIGALEMKKQQLLEELAREGPTPVMTLHEQTTGEGELVDDTQDQLVELTHEKPTPVEPTFVVTRHEQTTEEGELICDEEDQNSPGGISPSILRVLYEGNSCWERDVVYSGDQDLGTGIERLFTEDLEYDPVATAVLRVMNQLERRNQQLSQRRICQRRESSI
ncbi:hypothetical protein QAD02_023426, partial [Eretmocerus hayati]